jgi:cysteine desulfurase
VHPVAREAFLSALDEGWADPRRLHAEGRRARLLLDGAREALAEALGARPQEVHLTPGHTASLQLAVAAVARARRRTGSRIVVSAVERAAVLTASAHASADVVRVGVDGAGRVDLGAWATAIGSEVALAALQHANGEVGSRQPVPEAFQVTSRVGVPLLVDGGASVGHVTVGPEWDLLAADPGDWGGLPGVGVLAVRAHVRTTPTGPEDEDPWAPGGVSVPAAVAAAASLRAVLAARVSPDPRTHLVDLIRERVAATVPDVDVVGDRDRLPHVVTFSCLYVDGEALLTELDRRGFAVGSGSACTSSTLEPSHVLAAMGVLTHGNVRIALHPGVTADEVERFCAAVPEAVAQVRRMVGVTEL